MEMKNPQIPVVSNADAIFLDTVDNKKASLVKQLSHPVLWEDSIKTIVNSGINNIRRNRPRQNPFWVRLKE